MDFLVGNTYLEVKTPLQQLQIWIPDYEKTKKHTPFSSTDRFVRSVTELATSFQGNQRMATLLICFIYDNSGFEVLWAVKAVVDSTKIKGVEIW